MSGNAADKRERATVLTTQKTNNFCKVKSNRSDYTEE